MDFASPTLHRTGANSYAVSHGNDMSLIVEFSMEPIFQEFKSLKEGRDIWEDVPHVHIMFPGDKTREQKRPVRMTSAESGGAPPDPERWPRQWEAFQRQAQQPQSGTPLEHYAPLSKSQVRELKAANVHTVEQLANIPDTATHSLGMGGRELRDTAQRWLEMAANGAPAVELTATVKRQDDEIQMLKAQIAELAKETKRGPGRPRKDEEN